MQAETVTFPVAPGVSLRADRYGPAEGSPVILLHGCGQTRWSWGATARHLAQQGGQRPFSIYAVDMRGHGQSDWCPEGH